MVDLIEMLRSDKPNLPNKFTIAQGELIRRARTEANLSQAEFAKKAYINQAAISQIESGKRSVSSEEILYFSVAINKPISYFYSLPFLRHIDNSELSIIEEELLLYFKKLILDDQKKIIAQIKALVDMD
jgi:transcriptional regulator with XRE-family HTH domain